MDLALRDRPAWTEVVGVLAACALVLVLLAMLDSVAARDEAEQAREALAEQTAAARSSEEAAPEPVRAPAGTKLGDRGPIAVPVGSAWSAGARSAVARTEPTPTPEPALRRIVGPTGSAIGPVVTERATPPGATQAPEREATAATPLFALFAGVGVIMSLAGTAILARSR